MKMSCYFKFSKETKVEIPRVTEQNNVVFYEIKVKIQDVEWCVLRRFKDFVELHEQIADLGQNVSLPPKKIIGNKNPDFIEQRRKLLEEYVQNLLRFFRVTMPRAFLQFLEINKYDIVYLLNDLAHYFCEFGDSILMSTKEYNFSALELHSISERLCLPCPESDHKDTYDFSHVLDFCSKVQIVSVTPLHAHQANEGCYYNAVDVPIGKSNLIPKNLTFNLNAFRNINELKFYGLSTENISDSYFLKSSLTKLCVYNTIIKHINQILMCDSIHKEAIDDCLKWERIVHLDITGNLITDIDESIKLVPQLKTLIIDKNRLQNIEHLNTLSNLENLSLSVNLIRDCSNWHLELGNLLTLNLSQNQLIRLDGLKKLYSLCTLDLSCNLIEDLEEVDCIACLPMLENLQLTGNPLSGSVDYRPRVLARFHERAPEIYLDNERAAGNELDMALVLSALSKSNKNKT